MPSRIRSRSFCSGLSLNSSFIPPLLGNQCDTKTKSQRVLAFV
ncbi:hypothetical protein VIBHAR_06276 [Vibrio campbellii ATCC BAA-1116]|uniref:Uncharacterized protein n=1 Tax=Vibrio campbellii (strain ATCC BAA-1116) TaxID=2902295 RepID=A7N1Z5_VIBC1|nr:hypothetical protein VIBHAR_06276 [Vibrio campbellii ATCC BAA-1116]